MNKRQKGLTSAGTFLGLVCGLVLTQQVVSADTNANTDQKTQVTVQTASSNMTNTADSGSTAAPVEQQQVTTQASATDGNNNIVTNSSPAVVSDASSASDDTATSNNTVANNVAQPVAETTSDSSTSDATTVPITSDTVASGVWGTSAWDLVNNDSDYTLNFHAGTLGSGSIKSNVLADNANWINSLTTINFDQGVAANEDSTYLFLNLDHLSNINLANLDTSNVTTMQSMFYGDSNLTSLDLSNLDTSKVKNMSYMFENDSSLTSLDLSNFDTSNVNSMFEMFYGASGLTSLDLSHFDTSNVTDMYGMFSDDIRLSHLILGSKTRLDNDSGLANVPGIGTTIAGTNKVVKSPNWVATSGYQQGQKYSSKDLVNLTSRDQVTVYDWDSMPETTHDSILVTDGVWGTSAWDLMLQDGRYTLNFHAGTLGAGSIKDNILADSDNLVVKLNKINIDSGVVANEDSSYLFADLRNLINLDLSNLDTSNVTDMSYMFTNDDSLTTLNVSGLNTSNVTNMIGMFAADNSLNSLDLSNFDTSQVTYMDGMFDGDSSLTSLDLSNFNTSQVTDMYGMFSNDSSLTSLDLSNFDTSQVTDMSGMFWFDSSLTSLNLSNFDTSKVTSMNGMFNGDSSLSHLILGPKTDLRADNSLADVPKTGTSIPGTNKKVTSPNWVATSGYQQGQKYSSKDLMNLTGRDQVTVYDWDSTPAAATNTSVVHSVTRTINFHLPNGLTQTQTQRGLITRTKIVNSDGTISYSAWTPAQWSNVDIPSVPDYQASQSDIPEVDIDSDTADQTIDVYYTPIQHTLTINYVDADGKTVSSQKYSGAKGSTITPQYYLPNGYQLASVPPTTVQMDNTDQTINVLVSHALDFSDEQHSIVRLINVHQPNGQTQTVTQWVTLKRSVKIDRVTGAKTYGHWSMDYWDEYEVPTFNGYNPSQSVVEESPVSSDMTDQVVDIYYTQV